jgi:mono/diheme cytochrome c family protein
MGSIRSARRRRVVGVAAGLAALIVPTIALMAQAGPGGTATPASPVTGDASRGRDLYHRYACYACHGHTGETGARAFVPEWPSTLATEDIFIRFLRGRATISPDLPSTSMPSYAERTLSDGQARDIYAYIRTFRSHAPPLTEIDVLQRILDGALNDRAP